MIDWAAIVEILAQYEKHGWKLRRALLSSGAKDLVTKFDDTVQVIDSDIDALWFSRRSQPNSETWELRRLTVLPFALVAVFPTTATSQEVEAVFSQIENDMREKTMA